MYPDSPCQFLSAALQRSVCSHRRLQLDLADEVSQKCDHCQTHGLSKVQQVQSRQVLHEQFDMHRCGVAGEDVATATTRLEVGAILWHSGHPVEETMRVIGENI
jgi:hypothetical protein